VEVTPSLLSAKQLAADTSFVKMVEANTQLTGILYGRLRDMHTDKERGELQVRVESLLKQKTNASVLQAIKEMGFTSPAQFTALTSELSVRAHQVQARFGDYSKRTGQTSLVEAYQLSVPLKSIAEAQFWNKNGSLSSGKRQNQTLGLGGVCPNCHYNNCNDCGGDGGGGGGIDFPDIGGEDPNSGGSSACQSNCSRQRDIAISDARTYLDNDIRQSCGAGVYYTDEFLYSCFNDPANPNQSTACQQAACAANAYYLFQSRMKNAEDGFVNCYRNCR